MIAQFKNLPISMLTKSVALYAGLILASCFVFGTAQAKAVKPTRNAFFDGKIDSVFHVGLNPYVGSGLGLSFETIKYSIIKVVSKVKNKKMVSYVLKGSSSVNVEYNYSAGKKGDFTCEHEGKYIGQIRVSGKVRKASDGDLIADVWFSQVPHAKPIWVQCVKIKDGKPYKIPISEPSLTVSHLIKNVTVRSILYPLVPVKLKSTTISDDPRGLWDSILKTSHFY